VLVVGLGFLVWDAPVNAQTERSGSTRQIVNRVVPSYPQIARPLNLSGKVRFEVLVAPDGTVKTVYVRGGNAVLVRAAQNAILEWKCQKSGQPTTEVVEFNFTP
jgi:outer membrane biosynthesis protein TonB